MNKNNVAAYNTFVRILALGQPLFAEVDTIDTFKGQPDFVKINSSVKPIFIRAYHNGVVTLGKTENDEAKKIGTIDQLRSLHQEDPERAASIFSVFIEDEKKEPGLAILLAGLRNLEDDPKKSEKELSMFLMSQGLPSDVARQFEERFGLDKAIELYEKLLDGNGSHPRKSYFAKRLLAIYREQEDFDKIQRMSARLNSDEYKDPRGIYGLTARYEKEGKRTELKALLKKLVNASPLPEFYYAAFDLAKLARLQFEDAEIGDLKGTLIKLFQVPFHSDCAFEGKDSNLSNIDEMAKEAFGLEGAIKFFEDSKEEILSITKNPEYKMKKEYLATAVDFRIGYFHYLNGDKEKAIEIFFKMAKADEIKRENYLDYLEAITETDQERFKVLAKLYKGKYPDALVESLEILAKNGKQDYAFKFLKNLYLKRCESSDSSENIMEVAKMLVEELEKKEEAYDLLSFYSERFKLHFSGALETIKYLKMQAKLSKDLGKNAEAEKILSELSDSLVQLYSGMRYKSSKFTNRLVCRSVLRVEIIKLAIERGKYEEAVNFIHGVLSDSEKLCPENASLVKTLASLYKKLGRTKYAEKTLELLRASYHPEIRDKKIAKLEDLTKQIEA